ncbi:MAG TPA: hypothetical protein PKN33_16955 [Phycisphaerae bacterium]|nr:hypothetical protein [Phycisphaerae bacterium]
MLFEIACYLLFTFACVSFGFLMGMDFGKAVQRDRYAAAAKALRKEAENENHDVDAGRD